MNSQLKIVALGLGLTLQTACVPAFLDKYKREEVQASQNRKASPGAMADASS